MIKSNIKTVRRAHHTGNSSKVVDRLKQIAVTFHSTPIPYASALRAFHYDQNFCVGWLSVKISKAKMVLKFR